jgi:CRP/FNR family transcriptional regulator
VAGQVTLFDIDHDQAIVEAIGRSSLGHLPRELIARLFEGALMRKIAAGTSTHRQGDPPVAELVVTGLIRTYVIAPSGRTMTTRYSGPGALLGIATLFNALGESAARTRKHRRACRYKLQPAVVRSLAERDVRITYALLAETSRRAAAFVDELEASSFSSLRQRVARHLLDLAAEQQTGQRLVARVNQEELAGSIGTVRDIVVRILRDMRDEGPVRTGRGRVELLDPARLDAETYQRDQ